MGDSLPVWRSEPFVPARDVQNAIDQVVQTVEIGQRRDLCVGQLVRRAELPGTVAEQNLPRLDSAAFGLAPGFTPWRGFPDTPTTPRSPGCPGPWS